MEKRFVAGNFVLAIDNELVVKAKHIEATATGFSLNQGEMTVRSENLTHAWKIRGGQSLPLSVLDERTRIGGAILDMELCAKKYFADTQCEPWVASDSPVIFGAASLALTVINDRTSDDVDFALSDDFWKWRSKNWSSLGITTSETLRLGVFTYCGNWRARASLVEGLEGTSFRVMHPLDTVMQKLLRIKTEEQKFELKDKGDIRRIMSALQPSKEFVTHLLTENHLRYIEPVVEPGSRGRVELAQHSAIRENTTWFLQEFAPETSYDEICDRASQRHSDNIVGLTGRTQKSNIKNIAAALDAERLEL